MSRRDFSKMLKPIPLLHHHVSNSLVVVSFRRRSFQLDFQKQGQGNDKIDGDPEKQKNKKRTALFDGTLSRSTAQFIY